MTTDRRSRPDGRTAGPGLLLTCARAEDVLSWAARGVVPVTVAPLGHHTVLLPRGPSAVGHPYHDGAALCASRPAPRRLGPTVGCWVLSGRAVLTVQQRTARRRVRWVVWDPEHGVLRPPGLAAASPGQVVDAAGGGHRAELVSLLGLRRQDPVSILAGVLAVLGLPGGQLLLDPSRVDSLPGARECTPAPREVARFEDAVHDTVLLRRELGVPV